MQSSWACTLPNNGSQTSIRRCPFEEFQIRSAGQYLSAFKRQYIKLGHVWDDAINLELTDAMRSCKRGLGPSKQTGFFDVDSLFAWGQRRPILATGKGGTVFA